MLDAIKNVVVRTAEKMFGTKYERDMKRIGPMVDEINAHCESYKSLSDEELRGMTQTFREELAAGATLDDLLTRAFAVVKETCRRHGVDCRFLKDELGIRISVNDPASGPAVGVNGPRQARDYGIVLDHYLKRDCHLHLECLGVDDPAGDLIWLD